MPKSIKLAQAILWIQVIAAGLTEVAAIVMMFYHAHQGFWLGCQDVLATLGRARSVADYRAYNLGFITAQVGIILSLLVTSLWSLRTRRFWPIVICSAVLILHGGGPFHFAAVLTLAVLFLVIGYSGRAWLKRKDPEYTDREPLC